jgi:hypothetical protein
MDKREQNYVFFGLQNLSFNLFLAGNMGLKSAVLFADLQRIHSEMKQVGHQFLKGYEKQLWDEDEEFIVYYKNFFKGIPILGKDEIRSARKTLLEKGLIQFSRKGLPAKPIYSLLSDGFDIDLFLKLLK